MSISDDDILQAISETFRVESDEHIQSINRLLLRLEQGAVDDLRATLDEIAREAHTLKGASSILGLEVIQATSHAMESVFDALRDADRVAPAELYDLLYDALDRLGAACSRVADPTGPDAVALEKVQAACLRYAAEAAGIQFFTDDPEPEPEPEPPPIITPIAVTPVAPPPQPAPLALPPEPVAVAPVEPEPEPEPIVAAPVVAPVEHAPAAEHAHVAEETIRVPIRKLDSLMAQIGELLIARIRNDERMVAMRDLQSEIEDMNKDWTKLKEVRRTVASATGRRERNLVAKRTELLERMESHLKAVSQRTVSLRHEFGRDAMHVSILVDNLQEDIKKARMLPVATVLDGFHRLVRDVARKEGKQATLELYGTETEVDKRVLELIKDPLMHVIRNAVSHGIETPEERQRAGKNPSGTVTVRTQQTGGLIQLVISDDGRGIDVERVRRKAVEMGIVDASAVRGLAERDVLDFIFHSGLSTKTELTDVSGRGVGMDVVRENIHRVNGTISIETTVGRGTKFVVTLPLTLSTTKSLLVEASGQVFAIPIAAVERILRIAPREIESIEGTPALNVGGAPVAVALLSAVLGLPEGAPSDEAKLSVVLLNVDGRRLGLVVESLVDEREMVVKPLGKQLVRVRNVAGGTIVGSGDVLLVLNPNDLVRGPGAGAAPLKLAERAGRAVRQRVLLVEDSITTRTLEKNILETAGYEVVACKDGLEALAFLQSNSCDAVVTDVNMPRMDGFQLVERLRREQRFRDLPVLLVTSLGSDADRKRGLQVGANGYVVKADFEQGRFLDLLGALL